MTTDELTKLGVEVGSTRGRRDVAKEWLTDQGLLQ